MTNWFLYFQREPEAEWFIELAREREHLELEQKVPFTTVLDVDTEITEDSTADQVWNAHYRGPLYIDLDSKDPEEVCEQFKKLLTKLEEDYGVDLYQVGLFATGGRGYHLVFPPKMFMETVPTRGTPALPLSYLDMVDKLYVDTVDLSIYSMRKGRMFRVPNVQRKNKKYKVALTVEEAKSMTVEMYDELCAAPRYLPPLREPKYNKALGLLYVRSAEAADSKLKAVKNRKGDEKLLAKYGGKLPPTVSAVMSGQHINAKVGFQKIATQLAVAAVAVKMSQDDFLAQCEGLIDNHKGDSERYSTPAKRRAELKRMWMYMQGNPTYVFSAAAIKTLLDPDVETNDLDGTMALDEEAVDEEGDAVLTHGITMRRDGIYKSTDAGPVRVSAIGFANAKQLVNLTDMQVQGYELDCYVDGQNGKPMMLPMEAFTSRASFLKFCLTAHSTNVALTDIQVAALSDILRVRTAKNMAQVYTVHREGLDVILLPSGEIDVIWADQYGVESKLGKNYRLTGSLTDALTYRTDLRNAPPLECTPESIEFFEHLFKVNRPDVIARIFGFFTACFLSQPIRHMFGQFPFLQVYGQAGSGKSQTTRLFGRLHYHQAKVNALSALDATKFVYEVYATASGSVPFILDEYKPSEMRKDILEKSKGIIRSNYNGDPIGKGSVNTNQATSQLVVNQVGNQSPMVVISEAAITQTAQQERAIAVMVSKDSRSGRTQHFDYASANGQYLGQLGNVMRATAHTLHFDKLRKYVLSYQERIREAAGEELAEQSSRPIFNIAVCLTGLEFARLIFAHIYGDHFEETFKVLRESLTVNVERLVPKVTSEGAKVLSVIAFLSTYEGFEQARLNLAEDYLLDDTRNEVILKMRSVWTKYALFQRMSGDKPMYDNYESFLAGMASHQACVDLQCIGNPMKHDANTDVFAFDRAVLAKDGVADFAKRG